MDVKAIVMVGGRPKDCGAETIGGVPVVCLDVVGPSVLQRVLQRLQTFGISAITVVGDTEGHAASVVRATTLASTAQVTQAEGDDFWTAVEGAFDEQSSSGADLVLALRLGPYSEVDFERFVQHHLDHRCRISMVVDADGVPLEMFALSTCHRDDGADLFRSRLQNIRKGCARFVFDGYSNRLREPQDFRRLALDALLCKNAIVPEGEQKKPGVWVGNDVRIHRKARITAPAYIGARARIHAAALVTRGSTIEHGAEVDCGTVVENSSVLPLTYIGAGLDVMHSIVGYRRLVHLIRNVEVEIADRKLLGTARPGSLSRVAGSAAALFAFLPTQIVRGFFAKHKRGGTPELPESLNQQPEALAAPDSRASVPGAEATEFPSNLAVARRYGDQ